MSNKRIRVIVGGVAGVAELFEDAAPKTVKAVWAALPLDGTLNHANFSGEEISFPTYGVMWEKENQLFTTEPGDLGYFVQGPAICVYYGALRVISPGNVFGRVVENLPAIQEMARRSWREPGIPIRLEKMQGAQ
jgi:hypothetical protein